MFLQIMIKLKKKRQQRWSSSHQNNNVSLLLWSSCKGYLQQHESSFLEIGTEDDRKTVFPKVEFYAYHKEDNDGGDEHPRCTAFGVTCSLVNVYFLTWFLLRVWMVGIELETV